jgi:hypothetical protein
MICYAEICDIAFSVSRICPFKTENAFDTSRERGHCKFPSHLEDRRNSGDSSGPKIIKTSLKSQASDWLKWRPVTISANRMLEIRDWSPISVL